MLKANDSENQSVCDCSVQSVRLKSVLKDIEGMQQSMQRIFMEKKITKNKDETMWLNIQHVKKTDKNRKRKINYSLQNNAQACYAEKSMFLTAIGIFYNFNKLTK